MSATITHSLIKDIGNHHPSTSAWTLGVAAKCLMVEAGFLPFNASSKMKNALTFFYLLMK